MCDGQPADDCDVMNLAEFENTLKDRLAKLEDQFLEINDVLNTKKEAFTKMYRENPKISHEEAVSLLKLTNEAFNPSHVEGSDLNEINKQLIQLREQLVQQQQIADEAEEMRRAAEKQNEELQSVLDNLELEKSNLAEELREMKKSSLNLKNEIEELTVDLEAVTSSKSAADDEIKRLEELLHETQTRLQDAKRDAEQARKTKLRGLLRETQIRIQDAQCIKAEQAGENEIFEGKHTDAESNPGPSAEVPVESTETTPITESKQTIVCDGFSDDNVDVTVSSCKRRVKCNNYGYCFLDHP